MARTDKASSIAELEAGFRESNAALLTEYRGLTVAQLKQLRRSLASEAEYAVVKNTLTKIAANRAGVEGLDEMLAGPSAIAFVKGDAISFSIWNGSIRHHYRGKVQGNTMSGMVNLNGREAKWQAIKATPFR